MPPRPRARRRRTFSNAFASAAPRSIRERSFFFRARESSLRVSSRASATRRWRLASGPRSPRDARDAFRRGIRTKRVSSRARWRREHGDDDDDARRNPPSQQSAHEGPFREPRPSPDRQSARPRRRAFRASSHSRRGDVLTTPSRPRGAWRGARARCPRTTRPSRTARPRAKQTAPPPAEPRPRARAWVRRRRRRSNARSTARTASAPRTHPTAIARQENHGEPRRSPSCRATGGVERYSATLVPAFSATRGDSPGAGVRGRVPPRSDFASPLTHRPGAATGMVTGSRARARPRCGKTRNASWC